jgi:hypothetical protein
MLRSRRKKRYSRLERRGAPIKKRIIDFLEKA